MKEQKMVIENIETFNLTHIFECGQCFRWNKNEDESYTGVVGNNVINIRQDGGKIRVEGYGEDNIEELFYQYFDIDRNYENIKATLAKVDEYMLNSILCGDGIRILNQDLWETIISFIISANNNIPRIKGIIEKISKAYGNKIVYCNKEYYTFPTVQQLSVASVGDLRKLGLGFRDVRVYDTTRMILNKEIDLEKLHQENSTSAVRDELLRLPGVGPKVADCILLFSTLKRFDVFPIDVWVRRVMNDLYIHSDDEKRVSKKQILQLAEAKFGNTMGMAQQYLFYWKREEK